MSFDEAKSSRNFFKKGVPLGLIGAGGYVLGTCSHQHQEMLNQIQNVYQINEHHHHIQKCRIG